MFIRLRKESTGYFVFDRDTRNQQFIRSTDDRLFQKDQETIKAFLRSNVDWIIGDVQVDLIPPRNQNLQLSAPLGMYMEISAECNLDCSHCYKHEPFIHTKPTANDYRKLLRELHEMGVFEIRICGNEPTVSPFLDEVVSYAKELNFYVGINTNAYFGPKTQERLIALRPNFVAISLDGDRVIHDEIRKKGSYDKAISFLERLTKSNINRRLNMVVSKKSIDVIAHVASIARQFDADVSFLPFRPVGKHTSFNDDNALDRFLMRQVVDEIGVLRKLFPGITLLTYFDVLGDKAIYHHSMDFNAPCPARKNGFISCSGDFFPCDFLRFAEKVYFCGNVFQGGFERIWRNSDALHGFQNLEHKKCKKCKHYMTKCYGGCISGSIVSTGESDDQLCFVEIDGA